MKIAIKRIVSAILFFVIFFAVIMYAGIIGRPYYNGAYNYDIWQYFYAEDDNTHNVINIGSSAIYRYWAPMVAYDEQGFTSFTIGTTRQAFDAVPYIIEEVMKTQNPDLIVVETRSLINERINIIDDTENANPDMRSWELGVLAGGMNYSSTRYNMIHELYIDTEGDCELYWHIPILKYHSLEYSLPLTERLARIRNGKDPLKSTYLVSNVSAITENSAKKQLDGQYYLTDSDKASIDRIVKTAKDHDVDLLFVSTPYLMDKRHASMQQSFEDYILEKNYSFIDLNDYIDDIGLDMKTDFYNSTHTNVVGAEKVTSFLAKYLADNYKFDNVTLSEKQIKEWNISCEKWAAESEKLKKQWAENCLDANTAPVEYND
ncbi:MAG: hypothetical protein IJY93_08480 [Clostridia bacterium]|nr:hypothetical protein [Clostridia bacterium]